MKNRKWIFAGISLFILGAGIGLWSSRQSRASSPEGEIVGITDYLIAWDEEWQAIEAYHSSQTGYRAFDPSQGTKTAVSGSINAAGGYVETYPEIFVTKWRIHGHLHYE